MNGICMDCDVGVAYTEFPQKERELRGKSECCCMEGKSPHGGSVHNINKESSWRFDFFCQAFFFVGNLNEDLDSASMWRNCFIAME